MICDTMLKLISEKFRCQIVLKNFEWTLLNSSGVNTVKEDFKNFEAINIEMLTQNIQEKEVQIEQFDLEIKELADRIFRSPLCLIPVSRSNRPFAHHLKSAAIAIEGIDRASPMFRNEEIDENNYRKQRDSLIFDAWNEIELALRLLVIDRDYHLVDQATIWLFQADTYEKRNDDESAQVRTEQAFEALPEANEPHRLVVRLIQGNIYNKNASTFRFEVKDVYSDAIFRLHKLQAKETDRGNQLKAELYRILEQQLWTKLTKPREWKTTPHTMLVES